MFRSASLSCAILAAALALAAPAHAAPPEGKGKPDHAGQGHGKNKDNRDSDGSVSVTLSTAGISISTARGYAVQAGATGYGSLPPGIRKNLARGKPMPPGIAKKMVPGAMLARLPVHPGYEWRVAGSDLILVAIATSVVADVLSGVFD
ncbi:anti-virulence regulator CigR family protein [Achromobacter xylosoxidans]